jgi:hypothetical protein
MRFIVIGISIVAVLAAFVAVLGQALRATDADTDVVVRERAGVVFLHPMTTFVATLIKAQSAAVRGDSVDDAPVKKALDSLGRANGRVGGTLETQQRYEDLRKEVEAVLATSVTGRDAYLAYVGVVTLAMDLVRLVGDTSALHHDPDLDSYYLMDSALVQLPAAMVFAGRAADVTHLASGGQLADEDAFNALLARREVAAASEKVSDGLNKSVDSTARAVLGANITPQLDAFRAAADVFSPPTILSQLGSPVDPTVLQRAAQDVFDAALPLAHKLLSELDEVLVLRENKLADSRRFTVWTASGVAVLIILSALVLLLGRGRAGSRRALAEAGVGPGAQAPQDVALTPLTDVRRLMEADEFIGTRASGSRSRTRADAR